MQTSQSITDRSASNLAFAFILLGREKKEAMSVLYAFCREVDDIADEDGRPIEERRIALAEWREDLHRACNGGVPQMAVNRELRPVAEKYELPFDLFDELISGVESDLDQDGFETLEDLPGAYDHRSRVRNRHPLSSSLERRFGFGRPRSQRVRISRLRF